MTEDDFKVWRAKVGLLTAGQRIIMMGMIRQLEGNRPSSTMRGPEKKDWLFDGICSALKHKGLLTQASSYSLLRTRQYRTYKEHAPAVTQELNALVNKAGHTSLQKTTLGHITGMCLIHWAEKHKLPMTAATILSLVAHSREALELQFPGYINSGFFHLIITHYKPNG